MRVISYVIASLALASLAFVGTPADARGANPFPGLAQQKVTPEFCRQLIDQCRLPPAKPAAKKPRPKVRHHRLVHRIGRCVAYRVDGSPADSLAAFLAAGNPAVTEPLSLTLEFYRHSENDLYRLTRDPCFYAEDTGPHERLGLLRDCNLCKEKPGELSAAWPEGVPAGTRTKLVFHVVSVDGTRIGFPSGHGIVYLPRWFDTASLWCFKASGSYSGVATFGNPDGSTFTSSGEFDAYYDEIPLDEDRAALAKRLDFFPRVLRPAHAIGR